LKATVTKSLNWEIPTEVNKDLEARELPKHRSVRSAGELSESFTEDPIQPQGSSNTTKRKDE